MDNLIMHNTNRDKTDVITMTDIPNNYIIGHIQNASLLPICLDDEFVVKQIIEVHLTVNGTLVDSLGCTNWTNWVSAARDCVEQNVDLEPSKIESGLLTLRTTRPIRAGQRLYVWFRDRYALQVGVPILLPENILGFRQYRCTNCLKEFLFPNVLKSHLLTRSCQTPKPSTFSPFFPLNSPFACPSSPTSLPAALNTMWCLELLSRLAGSSPPASTGPTSSKLQLSPLSPCLQESSSMPKREAKVPTVHPINIEPSAEPRTYSVLPPSSTEPLDLIPRSLYTSKEHKGHLCIYCGKLYSRKYGLKIHLRTHTGYKPLKCKICLRPFGDPSNLNKHVRLHAEGDTPYRCEFCSKVLVRRRDLDRHIRSRHSDRATLINIFLNDEQQSGESDSEDNVVVNDEMEECEVTKRFSKSNVNFTDNNTFNRST